MFRPHPRQLDVQFGRSVDSGKRPSWRRRPGIQTSYLLPDEAAETLGVSEADLSDWSALDWLEAHRAASNGVLMYRWDEIVALKRISAEHGALTTELLRDLATR